MSRSVKVALSAIASMILIVVAVAALSQSSGRSRAPAVAIRAEPTTTTEAEVHVEICPPYCGEEPTTTTTVAPPPPTSPAPCPADVVECSGVNCLVTPDYPACPHEEPAPPPPPPPAATSGLSQAWLDQLATCESGNTNGWRTGYFGIEANGVEVGQLSYADQVAWVERILAETGPSAWGCITNGVVPAPY